MDWRPILFVALGGALGAVARYGASAGLSRLDIPLVTLWINLVGSFALGYLVLGTSDTTRLLVGVGFLGAFTTLSTYSVEMVVFIRAGDTARAVWYMLGNALGGPLMALLGWRLRAAF